MINARFRFNVAGAPPLGLPQQAVEILVCAFLPCAVRVGMDLPLLYFPRVSLLPWLFPLPRSTFRFPFTRYFS